MSAIRLNFSIKALPNRMAHLIEDEPLKSKGLEQCRTNPAIFQPHASVFRVLAKFSPWHVQAGENPDRVMP
jgi:hypothetical protein